MVTQARNVKAKVVNGINVDDLVVLIDSVKKDAKKGKTNWRVTTIWERQTRSRAQVEGFEIGGQKVPRQFSFEIDEPRELGGSNRFANPQEHLIAALNACMVVGYVAQCAVRGITIETLAIETDGEIDLRGFLGIDPSVPTGYEKLSYVVRIKGSGTKEEFAKVHEAVMATSPNFYNLSRSVDPRTYVARRVTAAIPVAENILLRDSTPPARQPERRGDDCLHERSERRESNHGFKLRFSTGQRSTVMKGSINSQDESKSSCPEQEFTEEQFLEQFAALEESLALHQTHMRRMSENAKLFGSLARHIRRSACPTTLSPR